MRVVVGSDHAGFELKEELKAFLVEKHYDVLDVGTYSKDPVDYSDYAQAVGGKPCANTGPNAASSSAAVVLGHRWPRTGFPGFAQACAMTRTRRTREWSTMA